jgi:hypothetical protein
MAEFAALAKEHPDDANINFLVAYYSFLQRRWDLFAGYAGRAYELNPGLADPEWPNISKDGPKRR